MNTQAQPESLSLTRVITHPLWLGSFALLVVNDHLLKGAGLLPGWLTGKLSDVAGMAVAPAVLAVVLRVKTARGLAAAHLATALGFTAMELSSDVVRLTDQALQVVGLRWIATRDVSDLLVLALLPWLFRYALRIARGAETRANAVFGRGLAAAGMLACAASAPPSQPSCQGDCDQDGYLDEDDCNDFDPLVNPGNGNCPGESGNEDCENGIDDDLDGIADCDDDDCSFACADTLSVCAQATTLTPTAPPPILLSTLTGTWALEGACGGADAPEVVRFIEPQGSFVTVVAPPGHVVYARNDCSDPLTEVGCATEGAILTLDLRSQGTTLIIDAVDALAASDFELTVTVSAEVCGDGVINGEEECDDGALNDFEGCSVQCWLEPEAVCAELAPLSVGVADEVAQSTRTLVQSSCGAPSNLKRGYAFTSAAPGTLSVTASSASATPILSADAPCAGRELACVPGDAGSGTLDLHVAADQELAVFVEGAPPEGEDFAFSLSATFTPD